MNEPLFSPSAPTWIGTLPASGWTQSGMGSRPGPVGTSGFGPVQSVQPGQQGGASPLAASQAPQPSYLSPFAPTPQYGFTTGIAVLPQPSLMFGPSGASVAPIFAAPGVYGVPGGIASAVPQDVPIGLTAPAILAAVAMRRGQPMGPTSDQEIEEFVYDVLELLPGTNEVEVRCEGGRATLTGSVQHKRIKHDVGEIVWAIPQIADVHNNVTLATRRRSRSAPREAESNPAPAGRKQT